MPLCRGDAGHGSSSRAARASSEFRYQGCSEAGDGPARDHVGLVLALLISSAKSSHDTKSSEVTQIAANFILLDRVLAHYGPETKPARELLRATVTQGAAQAGSGNGYRPEILDSARRVPASMPSLRKYRNSSRATTFSARFTHRRCRSAPNWGERVRCCWNSPAALSRCRSWWCWCFGLRCSSSASASLHPLQLHRGGSPVGMRAIGCRGNFPDSGARPAFRGSRTDFQRSPARRGVAVGQERDRVGADCERPLNDRSPYCRTQSPESWATLGLTLAVLTICPPCAIARFWVSEPVHCGFDDV